MKKYLWIVALFFLGTLSSCGGTASNFPIPEDKVLLEDFSDIECPYCAQFHPIVDKIRKDFPDDVVVRFVHFPLDQHKNAFHAAEAAECARDQGEEKFWDFLREQYKRQTSLGDSTYLEIASEMGMEKSEFEACLSSGSKADIIRQNIREGVQRGVRGTPTAFLDKTQIDDKRFEAIVKKIQSLLKEKLSTLKEGSPAL
ncbi:thioredoxin domain-containing protein [Candidatus Peregrinibacteria bacterium]|nr:thioredoxin domain-containing protein [Candidatus Peregrinibacteria bacterium]